ncbi:MAG: FAD-binding oxidoreductase [Lacunisphaera sp.]
MSTSTTVIIGGGVIGLSTAYHLARRGHGRIILLEKGLLGDGSSSRAAGISTGLLWSEAGVNARKVSLGLFRELSRELPGYHFHDERGCLNLFSPALWPDREKLLPLYDRLAAPYRILSAREIRDKWPALNPPDDFRGLHDPCGGYSEPPDYIRALALRVRELGVEIREQTKVTGFLTKGSGVCGVQTTQEAIGADAVVSTVYAWTLPVLRSLGVRLPVKHFVHQRYVTIPQESTCAFPPVNADPYGGYVRPAFGNRILLGVETAARDEWKVNSTDFVMTELATPDILRVTAAERMSEFLPALRTAKWEFERVGLISFSMDGEPILGPVSAVPGLFVGAAFHSGGFSYNPVAGLLLAEFVRQQRTSVDVAAFSPDRFVADQVDNYLATTVPQERAVRRRH